MNNKVIYDIIRYPVITEKSTMLSSDHNKVTFRVSIDADKKAIRKSVEEIFDVKVTSVNTISQQGKIKKFKGKLGKRVAYKKAIVTVAGDKTIDILGGVR